MQRHELEMQIQSEKLNLQNKEDNLKKKIDNIKLLESKFKLERDDFEKERKLLKHHLQDFQLRETQLREDKEAFENMKTIELKHLDEQKKENENVLRKEREENRIKNERIKSQLEISSARIHEKQSAIETAEALLREKLSDDRDVTKTLKTMLEEKNAYIKSLERSISSTKSVYDETYAKLQQKATEIVKLQSALSRFEKESENEKQKNEATGKELLSVSEELNLSNAKLETQKDLIKSLQHEISDKKDRIMKMEVQLSQTKNEVKALKTQSQQVSDAAEAKAQIDLRSLNIRIDEKESAINRLEVMLRDANAKHQELQEEVDRQSTNNAKLSAQSEEKEKEYERVINRMTHEAFESKSKISTLNQTIHSMELKSTKVEGDLNNAEESLKTVSTKMSRYAMKSTQDEEKINSLSVVLKDQESTIETLRTELQQMKDRNLELSIREEEGQKSAGILAANKAAALQQKLNNKNTLLEKATNELKSLSTKHKTVKIQLEKNQRNFAEQLNAKDKDFDLRFAKAKEKFDKEKEDMKEALTLLHEKSSNEKILKLNNDIAKSNLERDDLRKCTARQRANSTNTFLKSRILGIYSAKGQAKQMKRYKQKSFRMRRCYKS